MKTSSEVSESRSQVRESINRIKDEGAKVLVDFSKCQVIASSWTTEESRYEGSSDQTDIEFLNTISGDSDLNVVSKEHHVCRIVYRSEFKGKKCKFVSHPLTGRDEFTLRMLVEVKKTTYIYVDGEDAKNYYFDLDFLND
ncbi:MAG: hypothetical protein JXR03_11165 [Cyclobacteriaceae bacterium]